MGADNWADCPECGSKEHLREDYEVGFWNGNFHVDYSGVCQNEKGGCGYRFYFKILLDPQDKPYRQ